jgi:hypothetical protein
MDENTTTTETTETTEIVAAPTVKKLKVTKRTIEQLHEITPNKMTDAERIDYIKALREENNKLAYQADAFKKNAEAAFDQYRNLQQKFEDFKVKARAKINWARQCVEHARTSIILAGDIEED